MNTESCFYRVNKPISFALPPSKCVPNGNNKVKRLVRCDSQKHPRCQDCQGNRSDEVKNASKANTESSLNRDKGSKMHEEKKTQATTAGSRATTPYVSPYAQVTRKTAGPSPQHIAPNKAAPKTDVTEGPLRTNKQDPRHLEMQFRVKKKKMYAVKTELLKKQENFMEVYSSLVDLRDRILNSTGKDLGPVEEIKLIDFKAVNTADSKSSNKHQDKGAAKANKNAVVIKVMGSNPDLLEKVEKRLQEIPEYCMQLYNSVISNRNSISDLMNATKRSSKQEGKGSKLRELLAQVMQEGDNLHLRLKETVNCQNQIISEVLEELRSICQAQDPHLDQYETGLQEKLDLLGLENTSVTQKQKCSTEELENDFDKGSKLKDSMERSNVKDDCAQCVTRLLRKDEELKQEIKRMEKSICSFRSIFPLWSPEQNALFENHYKDYKQQINPVADNCCVNTLKLVQVSEIQHRILELLEGLDAHVRQVSWKQQDSEDKMSCMMPALKEVLEEHKQFISSLKVKQLQDSKITTLQTALAEQVKLADKERSNVKEACAKYDADIIKKDDEVRQLKEQVKELMDSLSSVQEQDGLHEKRVKDFKERINTLAENCSVNTQELVQVSETQHQVRKEAAAEGHEMEMYSGV